LLLTAFFLETGIVLILVPWSEFWDRNYFVQAISFVHAMAINNFVRGAISGIGVVNVVAALAELRAVFVDRRLDHSIITLNSPAEE